MADWSEVARIALALPETSEGTSYEVIVEAWLDRAPKRVAQAYLVAA